MVSVKYTIKNDEGLHARPAADFCKVASRFKSKIRISKGNESFEAKSIVMVLCVGAVKGDEIELSADGEDEALAIEALIKALDNAQ